MTPHELNLRICQYRGYAKYQHDGATQFWAAAVNDHFSELDVVSECGLPFFPDSYALVQVLERDLDLDEVKDWEARFEQLGEDKGAFLCHPAWQLAQATPLERALAFAVTKNLITEDEYANCPADT